jgi:hypothetical protein
MTLLLEWEASPELRWRGRILEQKWRAFVWIFEHPSGTHEPITVTAPARRVKHYCAGDVKWVEVPSIEDENPGHQDRESVRAAVPKGPL